MDIVSGFNHQKPGDNKKPLIFNEGENTYVLNRAVRPDGKVYYYGTDNEGRPIHLLEGYSKTFKHTPPAVIIQLTVEQEVTAATIITNADYPVDLVNDAYEFNVVVPGFALGPYKVNTTYIPLHEEFHIYIGFASIEDETLILCELQLRPLAPIRPNDVVEAAVVNGNRYDLTSIRV